MELPEVLSTGNPVHAQTIYQAIEASTQSPLEHIRKPAEQLLKACEEIPGYTSVLASIVGTRAAAADARAAAVILLKNMVRMRWRSRGSRGFVVGEGEKADLRGFLLRAVDEPEEKVASQLAVLMGKIARVDWPRVWPELFPSLVNSLVSGDDARRRLALCGIDEVLRELSMKRVGLDKAAFVKTAGELLPVLCRAWDDQWTRIEGVLALVVLGDGGALGAGHEATGAVALAINIRRLLQFGIPGLEHPQVEPFFHGLLHRMANVLAALEQLSRRRQQQHQMRAVEAQATSGGTVASTGDDQKGLVEELQELSERMAGAAVDAQKEHPIGFRRYLAAYLVFCHDQLVSAANTNRGVMEAGVRGPKTEGSSRDGSSSDEGVAYPCWPFCIRCLAFLGNVISCSSYRNDFLQKAVARPRPPGTSSSGVGGRIITAKGDAIITAEMAHEISTVVGEFYTTERVVDILRLLLEAFLPLTASDLEEWRDSPEQYYLLQDSLEPRESVRVSAEHLFSALLEAGGNRVGDELARAVATMLAQDVNDQLQVCRQPSLSPQELRLDALYLCAGLGAYTVKQHFDFQGWLQAFMAPALESLVSTMRARSQQNSDETTPAVLLRRLMWLLGCWSQQVPASLRPPLVLATANVMKAQEADVVVRLSALNALDSLMGLWDLDAEQCLAPTLGWLLPALYELFEDLEEMDSRQQVLTVMSKLLERSGKLVVPHCQAAVAGLPNVWMATSLQMPLRCSCLQVMTHVVEALGYSKGQDLDRVAVSMVDVATKVGSDDAVYLMESGLELWLALLRHAPEYDEKLHILFPRIPAILEDDLDHLKEAMLIIEAHVLVGGTPFLQAHGPLVCRCFCRVVGQDVNLFEPVLHQVKPQGAAFVSRALETLLRKFPAEGSRMLGDGGVLRKVLEACLIPPGEGSAREPDLVVVQHLTVLCRVLLGAPACFRDNVQHLAVEPSPSTSTGGASGGVGNGPNGIVSQLVGQMLTLFDSAGYSSAGVWRRRLWAMALLHLLPSANSGVISNLDQIVNICVDVLTEETEDGGKRLKEALDQVSSDGTEGSSPPTHLLRSRLEEALRADVAVVTDLRLLVRSSMDALHTALGDAGWQAAVETVEPVVLGQLKAKVA